MAVLNLDSINYMSAGSKGVTFNIDYRNDDTEMREQMFVLENKHKSGITTNNETEGSFSPIESKVNVSPMYDIMDLVVKSSGKKPPLFSRHIDHSRNKDIDIDDGHVDVFSAKLDKQPIGFTNYTDGNCYMLTESTTNDPRVKRTTLENGIKNMDMNEFYGYEVSDLKTHVVLYPSVEDIPSRAELIRSGIDNAEKCFEMKVDVKDVKSNYFQTIDQNTECHPFENGDIYGTIRRTKNAYNAMYSMEMPDENTLKSCRDYCGIGSCGSRLYLKYYDNQDYELTPTGNDIGTAKEKIAEPSMSGYPFQKVEVVDELDYLTSDAKHKSSIFSVRIRNTALGDGSGGISDTGIKQKLRKDIANTVRTLVEQTCPANTTLFDVYFED